ncbi:hypothetical protein [Mycobacterium simiae]|uniref:hypothetical protein n=1 Tax=Mycobacterium simiae TaxID=1784 RepID=UPI00262217B5|nr:hypothetical protein [Mycobacterium simiae]
MANSAQLLHARFTSWRGASNTTAISARGLNGENWNDHTQALRHLQEIEELIRLLESRGRNMRVVRETLPSWYQIVFAFKAGWEGQNTATINQQSLNTLEMLAERLEDVVPAVEDGGLAEITKYLDGVCTILEGDTSIPLELRAHINDVINHVRWCVDNYSTIGDLSLQDALERLAGAVVRGAANSTNPSKWKTFVTNFVWPFGVNMLAALPQAGLVALVAS